MKPTTRMALAGANLFVLTSGAGHAGVTIDVVDTGADVVVTASGTLNMSALPNTIGNFLASGTGILDYGSSLGSDQGLLMGALGEAYVLRSGPLFAGPDYPFFGAERTAQTQLTFSAASGDLISLGYSASADAVGIAVSNSYVNNSALAASGTFTGVELSRLGVTPGSSFTWTWGNASEASNDFLTINVAAIPEPSTYALMMAGLGLVGFAARRRRRM